MSWVVVESDTRPTVKIVQVVGPFDTEYEAEVECQQRHADRVAEFGSLANNTNSVVLKLVAKR